MSTSRLAPRPNSSTPRGSRLGISGDTRTAAPPPQPASIPDEVERQRQLDQMKARATGLLILATVVFIIARLLESRYTWVGFIRATAEASMVGGIADWFAVTALFRHPLGIPIPHTAVVVERKDQFALTLGDFIQESFLTPDAIIERLRAGQVLGRFADWLAEPDTATRLGGDV